ncbi:MAG: hypothetical protein NTZ03_15500 [Actinobacteria bacterium]|nr:hypothetical protein [Actinomycetota bacterium]
MMTERVAEAIRLGYRRLLVPPGTKDRVKGKGDGGVLIEVPTLSRAVAAMQAWG